MKSICTLLLLITACAPSATYAQRTRVTVRNGGSTSWIGGSALQTRVHVGADGQTYVGIWVDAPSDVAVRERAPMALSLVVDTSGSMSGAKIQHARLATQSLLESLQDGDIVSIYAFSNEVVEIAAPTVVSSSTRGTLMTQANRLHAMGGTNLHGGVSVGLNRVISAPASHGVRRVVLISDGHANIGITDPNQLGIMAANGSEYSVQMTAIGVGIDYDENTLGTLAVRSSGRLYHLGNPSQMASILRQEVELLGQAVATGAVLEIVPAAGVRFIEGVSTGVVVSGGRVRIPMGTVVAGQRREFLIRANVDTSALGSRSLADASLRFQPVGADEAIEQRAALTYEVVRDQRAAAGSEAPRVSTLVATTRAAQAERQAAAALVRNDRAAAARHYEVATRAMTEAAAAAPAPARARIQRQAEGVRARAGRSAAAASPAAAREAALQATDEAMAAEGF